MQIVAPPVDDVPVEAHQKTHLVRRTAPVLGRERIRREVLHANLDRTFDDVEERGLTGLVASGPRQTALLGPAAVTIHDDRHMAGYELGRDLGRPSTAWMRVRWSRYGHAVSHGLARLAAPA